MSVSLKPVMTPVFRVSYPSLFVPTAVKNDPNSKPKYSITMLIPKVLKDAKEQALFDGLRALAVAALEAKFGTDKSKWPKGRKNPFRDGDTDPSFEDKEENKGNWVISARNETKPGLVDAKVQPIISQGDFYGGCYARAMVTAFAYDKGVNRGVAFSLQNVQKVADGVPFGAPRSRAEDDFGPVDETDVASGVQEVEDDPLG